MNEAKPAAEAPETHHFSLGRIYLKDASVEAPNSPAAFMDTDSWDPKVTLEYRIATESLPEDTYEVALTLTVTAKDRDRTLFLVEIKQGGLFLIRNPANPDELDRFLHVRCPRILYPYAREAMDNLVVKAGFPPLMLAPIGFGSDYNKKSYNSKIGASGGAETIQ